jgi:hypothetical protein
LVLAARLWRAETDAIFTLAGPLAECRYLWPNQPSKGAIAGWLRSGDRKAARRCIARLARLKRNILTPMFPTPKYDELFDQLCDRTWAMVGDHWPAIERVAHALLEWVRPQRGIR